jgi:hypothetical protein
MNSRFYSSRLIVPTWFVAVICMAIVFAVHETKPGLADVSRIQELSPVSFAVPGFTPKLLIFLHPECPCSAASVENLARIMARCQRRVDAEIFIYQPSNQPDSWSRTSVWESARNIPGVSVHFDKDAHLAKAYGAATSGQTLLFDEAGRLIFAGGITPTRAHSGDSEGADAIVALVLGFARPHASLWTTPVYGCEIFAGSLPGRTNR